MLYVCLVLRHPVAASTHWTAYATRLLLLHYFYRNNRACEGKTGECSVQLNSSSTELQQNTDSQWLISDGKSDEHTHDASVAMSSVHAIKESNPEAEGVNQFHEQRAN
ncbi:hypothetical protein VitviT2T_015909 [Vitis vinifera]|uniref:Uncharacterized protein n=1 Tax=Vitis vinifera TaxID=29760 RepID=A0ABY9CPV0_VITVI|nr:hypothetical protein VitviT2T_015909 [Vitis vinifera]